MKNAIPSTSGTPLTNKWMLYVVFAAALYEMFSYFMRYDFYAISIFLIVGFLVSFFSKNMVVILIMAISLTRLMRYGQKLSEGFADEPEEAEEEEEEENGEEEEKAAEEPIKEGLTNEKKTEKITTMSDTTQKLLQNQKELMANMEALKPVLKQAESFLAASNEKKMEQFTTLAKAY
jgi:sensor histidine kinase regulating citrate/malate metabolism